MPDSLFAFDHGIQAGAASPACYSALMILTSLTIAMVVAAYAES